MKAHLAKLSLALLSTVFLLGCQDQGSGPVGPDGPQFDKPALGLDAEAACSLLEFVLDDKGHCHGDDGDPGTEVTWSFADLVKGDGELLPNSLVQSPSTCSGTPGAKLSNPTVEWKDGNEDGNIDANENEDCVTVTTTGTAAVTLRNDAVLIMATKKGSTTFTLQFLIQDKAGPDGIQYRTDRFRASGDNTEFTGAGFTLHVHSTVVIYQLKGHTGGPKVKDVGTIHISDIMYHN